MWQASKCIHIGYESGMCCNMIYGMLCLKSGKLSICSAHQPWLFRNNQNSLCCILRVLEELKFSGSRLEFLIINKTNTDVECKLPLTLGFKVDFHMSQMLQMGLSDGF